MRCERIAARSLVDTVAAACDRMSAPERLLLLLWDFFRTRRLHKQQHIIITANRSSASPPTAEAKTAIPVLLVKSKPPSSLSEASVEESFRGLWRPHPSQPGLSIGSSEFDFALSAWHSAQIPVSSLALLAGAALAGEGCDAVPTAVLESAVGSGGCALDALLGGDAGELGPSAGKPASRGRGGKFSSCKFSST